mmetsp:Transcript_30886/g.68197  ORF Transcript_30886/g.68197 Transcript_30886/m.68197 type:complete len:151 (-) Transcript_30886:336-788(-)
MSFRVIAARALRAARLPAGASLRARGLSDNITYSGGQATTGQGGFYVSGGSRSGGAAPSHYPQATARLADVLELVNVMESVHQMEAELLALGDAVTSRTIEVRSRLKKTISTPNVNDLLNRLEIHGEPVWGLSAKERDLVRAARDKYRAS